VELLARKSHTRVKFPLGREAKPLFETDEYDRVPASIRMNSLPLTTTVDKERGSPAYSQGISGPMGGYFTGDCEISGLEMKFINRRRAKDWMWRILAILCAGIVFAGNPRVFGDDKDWVPLKLKLPAPVFAGTPKQAPPGVTVDPPSTKPPVIMVPPDARNIAPKAKLSSSDKAATTAMLAKITDGDKEAEEDSVVLLHKGLQWIQFDFGSAREIFAIAIWHAHDTAKIYRSVIVQAADDADFTENVRTLFNNDIDNRSGLGAGTDRQYFESFQGKTVDAKGTRARYVRLYSHGSTDSAMNEYTEVEIYGRD
jgi:hypothetical protein